MNYTSMLRLRRKATSQTAVVREMPKKIAAQAAVTLGFLCPFQPTMQSRQKINETCVSILKMAEAKMMDKYGPDLTWKMVEKITKVFNNLNYNSYSKSIAVLLEPGEEKIIYLDHHVSPLVITDKNISVFDILNQGTQHPDFYVMFLQAEEIKFYEYSTDVTTISAKTYPGYCPISTAVLRVDNDRLASKNEAIAKALRIHTFLNNKHEKPLFITGDPELVDKFCNQAEHTSLIFKKTCSNNSFSEENLERMIAEISVQWDYWNDRYISNRVLVAAQGACLTSNMDAVLKALKKGNDGVLVIDQHLHEILSTAEKNTVSKELLKEAENFLQRGNKIVFANTALLKNFGRIVLLPKKPVSTEPLHKRSIGHLLLF